ncbi:hypothetical protein BGZ61DRAFT_445965 [Ilyonectria robusta]|uniref:uncharacterized protein n=1 Tax=Ilyonectria robusta TaxID=1079257 RepID=UPI001E8CD2CC|nr:uncharacterized protein BGZ61DRAFT_445965 [Ilyonectria robusta]KAH8729195.1 hypothetical protein BGZ61DRAFT_445965 [Ilyonectria robusta]
MAATSPPSDLVALVEEASMSLPSDLVVPAEEAATSPPSDLVVPAEETSTSLPSDLVVPAEEASASLPNGVVVPAEEAGILRIGNMMAPQVAATSPASSVVSLPEGPRGLNVTLLGDDPLTEPDFAEFNSSSINPNLAQDTDVSPPSQFSERRRMLEIGWAT